MLTAGGQYEICSRPQTVDLLVSLAFIAAAEGGLSDFPDGMNLQVPVSGELVDFDSLSAERVRLQCLVDAQRRG